MHFTFALVLLISALTSLVSAQISSNDQQNPISYPLGGNVNSGSTITITWNKTFGNSVNLILRKGKDTNLDIVETIASDIPNSGAFAWSIPQNLAVGSDYSIEIISGTETNYSPLFGIDSTVSISSTSSSSSTSSTSTSSTKTSSSLTTPISSAVKTSSVTSTSTNAISSGSSNFSSTTTHSSTSGPSATGATAPSINASTHLAFPISLIISVIAGLVYLC